MRRQMCRTEIRDYYQKWKRTKLKLKLTPEPVQAVFLHACGSDGAAVVCLPSSALVYVSSKCMVTFLANSKKCGREIIF